MRTMLYRFLFILALVFLCMGFIFIPDQSTFAQDTQAQAPTSAPAVPSPPAEQQAPANAENPDSLSTVDRFKKPMPIIDPIPEKEFLEATEEFKVTPYGEKSLAYSIRYPKGWEIGEDKSSSNFDLNTKLFTSINIWYSPPRMGGRSRLEVKAVDLKYQLTAEQWFLQYIMESGQTLEGFSVIDDNRVEALMLVMEEDTTYYLRSITVLNGKRVLQVQFYVPGFFWNDEKALQAQCVKTFAVTYPMEEIIENMLTFPFFDIAEVKYPESWKLSAKPLKSVERMNAKFLNIRTTKQKFSSQETIEGQIDITLISATDSESLISEIEEFRSTLEGTGMLVGEKKEVIKDIKYNENYIFGLTEVYEGIDSTNDAMEYELWYTVLVSGSYYYFVTLLTPSRNDSFILWARNSQSYKTIVELMAPNLGGYIENSNKN